MMEFIIQASMSDPHESILEIRDGAPSALDGPILRMRFTDGGCDFARAKVLAATALRDYAKILEAS
jgi:hypothetical protein